ncbi:hypothetical protein A8L34_02140 [Bacillus sp. FJAT-27264]|uniref:hypothetical protein n=1 Tax=Paenibacillus sp. (strain DSM 101736 / FJAT-27264) TaxID=1850362 RepID=UPI000807D917|nr:hypothetical protein [Bacillus sp. FJAT-27264]OBZ18409.1 hypothetical protein A8L34_02140 [Bacillus sp. FJAT-27264]
MKKNSPKMIAALAVVSLTLLAGCTELPGKAKVNQESEQSQSDGVEQNLGEAVKQGLGQAAAAVTQAAQDTADKVVAGFKEGSISKELQISQTIGSASALSIENSVGVIAVRAVGSDQINVKATIQSYKNFNSEQERQEILDNAEVSVQISGDKLIISTHAKDAPKKDLWSWAQRKYGSSDFSIDYDIEVPKSVDMYQVSNDVGKIQLSGLQGTYRVSTDVGAIHISDATIAGKSTIESDTGSITLNIAALNEGSSLKAKTDVGPITATLAGGLNYSLEVGSEIGQIKGATKGKSKVGNGGPLVSLSSDVGAITVHK